MKINNFQLFIGVFIYLMSVVQFGCKKDNNCKDKVKGRIIGFHPCWYYAPSNERKDGGFVIEIEDGSSKDTVVSFQIPSNLFPFPEINQMAAINGQYLYPPSLQDQFKIELSYRLIPETEGTFVLCLGNVNIAPFLQATEGQRFRD
ncbi:MAG TPA: hypothetical protein PKV73_14345 [Agriterribacter sp.]|nr:hypothetical protein [Agriterribacter sp.]